VNFFKLVGVDEVAALKAEVAQLRAQLAGKAPEDSDVPTVVERAPAPAANVVPLPKPRAAAPAAKASPSLDDVTAAYSKPEEPWRSHLNRNFDPWADNR
jgi:hypothetical protein